MRHILAFSALLAALVWAAPARSDPPGVALRLYAAGDFVAAAEAADAQPSAASLAFAASALVAACAAADTPAAVDTLLRRAESKAREALALDESSVDARLQLALVYGLEGRRASLSHAFTEGYAPRGRRLIDEALAREPDNAHAHALLGAWHLEIIDRGGAAGAFVYGARLSRGLAEFERARALAPDDPLISLHYAVGLMEIAPETYRERAARLLDAVIAATPRDAMEALAQRTARRLQAALERGTDAARNAARDSFL